MLRIGITGGIGAGKTTISKCFVTLGVPVFNSDECAKQLVLNPVISAQIKTLLGNDSYTAGGTYNRPYISNIVFNDKEKLAQLNGIIHPAVAQAFDDFCTKNAHHKYVLKESALLFETKMYQHLNATIVVIANLETRIARVTQRDNSTATQVQERINNQLSDTEKIKLANYVISNNNDSLVLEQILKIHTQLMQD
ncbi:MAG: dephospho-CoA kinase [Bacteroidia bacterium]